MSSTRKYYKTAKGITSKGPRPKCKIIKIDVNGVHLDCGHIRFSSGKEKIGGFRFCELCPSRKRNYSKGSRKGWAIDK